MFRLLTFRRGLFLLIALLVPLSAFAVGQAAAPRDQFPAIALTTFPAVVTVVKSANVRAGPGTDFPVISGARPGQRLTVLGCNVDCTWYQLDNDCWIAAFLVKPEQPVVAPPAANVTRLPGDDLRLPTVVVSIPITAPDTTTQTTRCPQTIATVNTYAGPGTFYAVVEVLPAGTCVATVGRNALGDWVQLSKGMWLLSAAILYAEPVELLPVNDRIFTATPEPTPTPIPSPTSTLTPTPFVYAEILTVGEWINASPEAKAATATVWTQRYLSTGRLIADPNTFAVTLLACVDNTLRATAAVLGPAYLTQIIADGCANTLAAPVQIIVPPQVTHPIDDIDIPPAQATETVFRPGK